MIALAGGIGGGQAAYGAYYVDTEVGLEGSAQGGSTSRRVQEGTSVAITIPECDGVKFCNDYFTKQMQSCFANPGQQAFVMTFTRDSTGKLTSWSSQCI